MKSHQQHSKHPKSILKTPTPPTTLQYNASNTRGTLQWSDPSVEHLRRETDETANKFFLPNSNFLPYSDHQDTDGTSQHEMANQQHQEQMYQRVASFKFGDCDREVPHVSEAKQPNVDDEESIKRWTKHQLFPQTAQGKNVSKDTIALLKMNQQQTPFGNALETTALRNGGSMINGGVASFSTSSPNMFKKDLGKSIRQFQNQTTNQFIQRTITSNLTNITQNRPNIASDRAFLEGIELGMQLNGFLNKLSRDSKDYVKDLLDGVTHQIQIQEYQETKYLSQPQGNTSTNPTIDPFVQSFVQNAMQKSQQSAYPQQLVKNYLQEAIQRTQMVQEQ